MDKKIDILIDTFFSTEKGQFNTLEYLENLNSMHVKNQLNIDLSKVYKDNAQVKMIYILQSKITNTDLLGIFKQNVDLYYDLYLSLIHI